jgi:tetratricopeptide (TPR) repeat protein
LLRATNRLGEAEPLYRRALAIDERSLGPDHPKVATDLNNLAKLLRDTNRLDQAEPLYRRALAIGERSLGPDHPSVAIDLNNLARLLQATNRLGEAEPLYRRALAIVKRSYGPAHPNVRTVSENYGLLLSALKLSEPDIAARIKAATEGTEKLEPIVPEVERLLGPAKSTKEVFDALDRQYRKQSKAAVYFLGLKEPIASHLDELLRPNAEQLTVRGVAAFRRGGYAEAVVLYDSALGVLSNDPTQTPLRLTIRMNRAAALRELGLVTQACDELSGFALEIEKTPAAEPVVKGRARFHLALCQWRLGDRQAAQKSAEESLAAYNGAPKDKPVDRGLRQQSEKLLTDLKEGKDPPPLAQIDAQAALEAVRAHFRAREALTKLPVDQKAAPLLDEVLGPAKSTK